MQNSIIVYRNPWEKAMWESDFLPTLIVFVISLAFFIWLSVVFAEKFIPRLKRNGVMKFLLFLSFALAFVVTYLINSNFF